MRANNEQIIIDKLCADGDLRKGEHELYEVEEDDDLGFYQTACEYLLQKLLIMRGQS